MKHQCLGAMKIMPIISQVSPKILLSCKPSGRAKQKQSHFTWPAGFQLTNQEQKWILQSFFLETKYQLDKQTAPWKSSSKVYHRYSDPNDLLWKRLNICWGLSWWLCVLPNHAYKTLWWCCGFISRTIPVTSEHSELVFTQSLPEMDLWTR